jgi:hypothetical protein
MPQRLSSLNVGLLIVTAIAVLFGGYGWFLVVQHDDEPPPRMVANIQDDDFERHQPRQQTGTEALELDWDPADLRPQDTEPAQNGRAPEQRRDSAEGSIAPAAAHGGPSDAGDAVISGRVLGPGGTPITGVTVVCVRTDLQLSAPSFDGADVEAYRRQASEFLRSAAAESRRTTTNDRGEFRFTGLDETLSYNLRVRSHEGLSGEAERVAAGDSTVIFVVRNVQITGRVQDERGDPVTRFTVRHHPATRNWEARTENFQSEDGSFTIDSRLGRMQLEVQAPGFKPQSGIEVDAGTATAEVVVTLERGAILTGIVRDSAGNPLPNVEVGIGLPAPRDRRRWQQGWQQRTTVRSDSRGRYRMDSIEPGETVVNARFGSINANETVTLTRGENTLDFTLEGGSVARIRLATNLGDPLDAEQVWMQTSEGNWARPERLPSKEPGLIELAGIEPGTYTVTLTVSGFPALRREIEVRQGESEFNFELSQGAVLTGTVRCNSGSSLAGMSVRLRQDDEQRFGGWGTGRIARLDENGAYRIGPAEPGQWNIELYRQGNWTPVYESKVNLSDGENTHDINVDSGATLAVRLQDPNGNPIGWGEVRLRGEENHTGRSDAQGVATISFVTPGSYTLQASARGLAAPILNITLVNGSNSQTVVLQPPNCARLTHIYPDTQAAQIGLEAGDIVLEYNGVEVTSYQALARAIRATSSGDDVVMRIERNGVPMTLQLKGGRLGIEGSDGVR